MSLTALLDESLIKVGLESLDKDELFEEMVDLLVRAGRAPDRDALLEALWEREAVGTTGIGKGLAVPHVKLDNMTGVAVCAGTSEEGIEYDAIDDEPVYVVFMVVSSKDSPELNVQTLASIAHVAAAPGALRRLREAQSAAEVLETLAGLEVEE